MISAEEARRRTNDTKKKSEIKQWTDIETKIHKAIANCESCVNYNYLTKDNEKKLRELGYTLTSLTYGEWIIEW